MCKSTINFNNIFKESNSVNKTIVVSLKELLLELFFNTTIKVSIIIMTNKQKLTPYICLFKLIVYGFSGNLFKTQLFVSNNKCFMDFDYLINYMYKVKTNFGKKKDCISNIKTLYVVLYVILRFTIWT